MRDSNNHHDRHSFKWPVLAISLFWWAIGDARVNAQATSPPATRVEEDWELVVGQPDTSNNGPQVTCTISPMTMNVAYAAFDVNFRTQPDYSPGGLQLHTWDPEYPIVTQNLPVSGMLATPGETITWTMRMYTRPGYLKFRIVNGQSQTWGAFASSRSVAIPWPFITLDDYDPSVSVNNSGVSFSSNLVISLKLKAVRWYDAFGNVIQQVDVPQVVYPQP